jgi:DNA-binding PadR family transcriptional regulator
MGVDLRGASIRSGGERLSLNNGTLYPALLKLEQEGAITSEWGAAGRR